MGVLFEPDLPRMRARTVAHFLATKYAAACFAAAMCVALVPASLGALRLALASLVLMPVPSVCVRYALDHDADDVTAACLANYSQVLSLVALCALGAASSLGGAAAPGWVAPAALAMSGALVAAVGALADRGLAPVKMTFRGAGAKTRGWGGRRCGGASARGGGRRGGGGGGRGGRTAGRGRRRGGGVRGPAAADAGGGGGFDDALARGAGFSPRSREGRSPPPPPPPPRRRSSLVLPRAYATGSRGRGRERRRRGDRIEPFERRSRARRGPRGGRRRFRSRGGF